MVDTVALGQPTVGEPRSSRQVQPGLRVRMAVRCRPDLHAFEERFADVAGRPARPGHQQLRLRAAPRAAGRSGAAPATRSSWATTPSPRPGTRSCGRGATPVFADVRPDIWSVDPAAVEAADHPAHGRHHRGRRLRPARRLRRAARHRRPARPVAHRGRRLLGRRHLQGPPGRQPRRHRHASASTAARASPPARAARSRTDDAELAAHARKLHTYGIAPALTREGARDLPVPVVRRARLQLPDVRRRGRRSCWRSSTGCPQLLADRRAAAAVATPSCWATSSRSRCPSSSPTASTPGSPTSSTLDPDVDRGAVAIDAARPAAIAVQLRHVRLAPPAGLRRAAAPARSRPTSSRRHLAIPMHANLTERRGRARSPTPLDATPLADRRPIRRRAPTHQGAAPHDRTKTVFFTGGAGFIGLHVVADAARARLPRSASSTTCSAVTATRSPRWSRPGDVELIDQDVRYGGAVHQAMKGCEPRHPLRRRLDQQEPGRPVRVDGHQHGRQPQRLRRRRRPRRRAAGVRLQRLGLRRPREAARCTRTTALDPLTPYCISKRAGEDLLGFYQRRAGPVVDRAAVLQRLRPGPEDDRLLHVGHQPLRQPAQQRRAAGHRRQGRAVDGLHPRRTTSPAPSSWRWSPSRPTCRSTSAPASTPRSPTLARILIDAVGVDVEPQFNPRDVLVTRRAADITRAKEMLGFEPTITVERRHDRPDRSNVAD